MKRISGSIFAYFVLYAGILANAGNALANDGIGELGMGGIVVYGKTEAVAMRKEVLEISTQRIDVAYEFINTTQAPVTLPVVFPLPTYGGIQDPEDDARGGQPENFSVLIDGVAHPFTTNVSAWLHGGGTSEPKNITSILQSIGLTQGQIALLPGAFKVGGKDASLFKERNAVQVPPVTRAQLDQLRAKGLLVEDSYSTAAGPKNYPAWKVQITYAWNVTFPPGKPVSVKHSYKPFVGAGITQSWLLDQNTDPTQIKEFQQRFCASPGLISKFQKTPPPKGQNVSPVLWGLTVKYILNTANTWKGPIQDFTLRLKKNSPTDVITLCFPGDFKKVDALTLETHLANFKPTTDLEIRYLDISRESGSRPPYAPNGYTRSGGSSPQGISR